MQKALRDANGYVESEEQYILRDREVIQACLDILNYVKEVAAGIEGGKYSNWYGRSLHHIALPLMNKFDDWSDTRYGNREVMLKDIKMVLDQIYA